MSQMRRSAVKLPRVSGWVGEFDRGIEQIEYEHTSPDRSMTTTVVFDSLGFIDGFEQGVEEGGAWEVWYSGDDPGSRPHTDQNLFGSWRGLNDVARVVKSVDKRKRYGAGGRVAVARELLKLARLTLAGERCERVARGVVGASKWIVDPDSAHDRESVESLLDEDGISYRRGAGSSIVVSLDPGGLKAAVLRSSLKRRGVKFSEL